MINRRTLLDNALKVSAGFGLVRAIRGLAMTETVIGLRLSSSPPVPLPSDFMGLGYEMSSVARLGLLSKSNETYVNLVKQLGTRGVLRVGGIVADFTRYVPNGVADDDRHNTVITQQALEQFGAFLKAVGWTAIWSVNFAQGSIADAVTEATAVQKALGSNLQALELGNEVENYATGRTYRKAPYTFEQYLTEYREWRSAILNAVPNVRFAAPDTATNVDWVEKMSETAHGDVQLLTTHYYRNGQRQGSADQLSHADQKLIETLVRIRSASQRSGIPWRMCETNSFSGGGLPGVSDTLLGALWTLDYMALLAKYGCSGVNIETGVNQLGFISSYSPIRDDGSGNTSAGLPYYGMLAFAMATAGCTQTIAVQPLVNESDVTAYAFGNSGRIVSLTLVNRSPAERNVSFSAVGMQDATALRLSGSAQDSAGSVTFGGAMVNAAGRWSPSSREHVGDGMVRVAPMTAVVLRRT